MADANNQAPNIEDDGDRSQESLTPMAGYERAATIALLATHPAVVAGRALKALSKDAPGCCFTGECIGGAAVIH